MRLSLIQELNNQTEQKPNIFHCCEIASEVKENTLLVKAEKEMVITGNPHQKKKKKNCIRCQRSNLYSIIKNVWFDKNNIDWKYLEGFRDGR